MPKKVKKLITERDNPARVTRNEVTVALNNALAFSQNFLESYLDDAQRMMKVDGNGKKIKGISARALRSYTTELVKPLLEMVEERLILKEELIVALVAAAMMVNQKEI